MKRGGKYISIAWALPSPEQAAAAGITAQGMLVHPDASNLSTLAQWVDNDLLSPVVEHIFPLRDAQQAHQLGEEGHVRGKIVLDTFE